MLDYSVTNRRIGVNKQPETHASMVTTSLFDRRRAKNAESDFVSLLR